MGHARSLLGRLASASRIGVLGAAFALAACASSAESAPTAATAQSAATKAPVATNAQGHLKLLTEALGEVPLRPEQRAEIEKLANEAGARHAATQNARTEVLNALAAQVEAGAIDRAALQPKVDAAADAWAAARPGDRAAIERLHAILDAGQRAQLVDAIRERFHHGGDRHAMKGRMEKLAADLKLTDDQKDKIKAIVHEQMAAHHGEWKGHHAKGKAMMEAFKSDHFVLDEVAPPVDARAKANELTGHVVGVIEKILPTLTPEQRALVAAKIRAHAAEASDLGE